MRFTKHTILAVVSAALVGVCCLGVAETVSASVHKDAKAAAEKHGKSGKHRHRHHAKHSRHRHHEKVNARHHETQRTGSARHQQENTVALMIDHAVDTQVPEERDGFDRVVAARALRSVDIDRCKVPGGPVGDGHVMVHFEPSGRVSSVIADQAPFASTPVGECIAKSFKAVRIPAFRGGALNVGKTFFVK
jgi:hypothetical protein